MSRSRSKGRFGTVTSGTIPPPSSPGNLKLIYGHHAVTAAWINPDRVCRRLLVTEGALASFRDVLAQSRSLGLRRPDPTVTSRAELDRLLAGAVHQGIALDADLLEPVSIEDLLANTHGRAATILALDQVTDPHNVGAILRSASAFGAAGVIVTRHNAPDITGVLAKSASGAAEHVPYVRVANLARALEQLMDNGFTTIALDERAEHTLDQSGPFGRTVLIVGAEGEGLRRLTVRNSQLIAKLPTGGPVGSLNVSNAVAVGLYELTRNRTKA